MGPIGKDRSDAFALWGRWTTAQQDANKPTIEQVAWVFDKLYQAINTPMTFRNLIYKAMGFGPEAYEPLFRAGGMTISNGLYEIYNGLPAPVDTSEEA